MGKVCTLTWNAIRRDEDLDNIHSVYVDQWDWEKIISRRRAQHGDLDFHGSYYLYSVLRKTEKYMAVQYDYIEEILPREIAFVSTQELVDMYPELTPKEREYKIVKEKGAVFLMQVVTRPLAMENVMTAVPRTMMTGN